MEMGLSTLAEMIDANARIAYFHVTLTSYRNRNQETRLQDDANHRMAECELK
jgi:hypothetical protein